MNYILSRSCVQGRLCNGLTGNRVLLPKVNRCTKVLSRACTTEGPLKSSTLFYHRLLKRAVIRVFGPDAATFLQGLMTNDIRHLIANGKGPTPMASIYSMLLNQQGRVLYDVLVYKTGTGTGTDDSFLVECDHSASSDLIRHLTGFKLRKRVELVAADKRTNVWSLFALPDHIVTSHTAPEVPTENVNVHPLSVRDSAQTSVLAISPDPRQRYLGTRLVLADDVTPPEVTTVDDLRSTTEVDEYRLLRFRLGIAEGVQEIPSGSALPLEFNADYLHGVSFQKGCYIGQELTARIHHTGVVRKRLLPLVLDDEATGWQSNKTGEAFESLAVLNEAGKTVGRTYGVLGRFGVGVMRLQECLSIGAGRLVVGAAGSGVRTYRPFWWPVEAPKENLATVK